jgi:isocitrate/isopropylmalate dehydrogenase
MKINTTLPCAEVNNAMQLSLSVYSQRIQRAKRRALGSIAFWGLICGAVAFFLVREPRSFDPHVTA